MVLVGSVQITGLKAAKDQGLRHVKSPPESRPEYWFLHRFLGSLSWLFDGSLSFRYINPKDVHGISDTEYVDATRAMRAVVNTDVHISVRLEVGACHCDGDGDTP